jgi:hypothetical protein
MEAPAIRSARWSAACLLAALLPVTEAAAEDGFHVTATTIVEWHADNRDSFDTNDDFLDVINKINLSFGRGILRTDLRVDTFTLVPIDPPGWTKEAPTGKTYSDDYRLERITGVLRPHPSLALTLGDLYAQFGNGIALSLRKVDELGLETVLRGGRLDLSLGPVDLTVLGGVTNVNNLDPLDLYLVEDPLDRLAGVRSQIRLLDGRLSLGVHGVWCQPSRGDARSAQSWIAGGNAEAVLVPGRLLMGAELDHGWFQTLHVHAQHHPQRWREPDGGTFEGYHTGFAAYLNLRARAGPVSILAEGKWYDTFALEGSLRYPGSQESLLFYSQPPTAERLDQEIENFHTVVGGRVKVDVRLLSTLSLFANVSGGDYVSVVDVIRHRTRDEREDDPPLHLGQYLHVYGGLDVRWDLNRSTLSISGGWRGERDPEDVSDPDLGWHRKKVIAHGEAKLNLYLTGPWTLHVAFLHEWRTKREVHGDVEYNRGTHIMGVDWSGVVGVSVGFEYDTDPSLAYPGEESGPYYDMWRYHGWGRVRWVLREDLVLSVMGGTQRGGLKCVGGVCKILPPFAGVRTELVFRY